VQTRRSESKRLLGLDRLPPLRSLFLSTLLASVACEESKSAPPPSRVVAVSQAKKQADTHELCDVLKIPEQAPSFVYPPLTSEAPKQTARGWHWINVWATWCPPCTEELPLIVRLRDNLKKEGLAVELSLLSVDQTPDAVAAFAVKHPEVKGSLQVKDASALEAWLPKLGLDSGATLPIHLFLDPQNRVRCARTGALKESDLGLLRKLLSGV
jgi:thiol-disulfide isomerase/thioredoxin